MVRDLVLPGDRITGDDVRAAQVRLIHRHIAWLTAGELARVMRASSQAARSA